MLYEEHKVKSRKDVIRVANKIIKEIRKTNDEYVIVWGKKDNIDFVKRWESKKYKPKMTTHDVNKGIVNALKRKFGNLGEEI